MIERITKEQEDLIPSYLKKGLDIGLKTGRMNKNKAKKALKYLYNKILDRELPEVFFVPSIVKANKLINKKMKTNSFYYWNVANFHCGYNIYKLYLGEVLVPENEITQFNREYIEAISQIGITYFFDEMVVVCEFPEEIHFNDEDQLHKNGGMAVKFSDGTGLYALNGVIVPEEVALVKPSKITKEMIFSQTNEDIQRELIRKMPAKTLAKVLDVTVVEKKVLELQSGDSNKQISYELVDIALNQRGNRRFLKMSNPSIDAIHIEGVENEVQTIEGALKFRNKRNGLPLNLT